MWTLSHTLQIYLKLLVSRVSSCNIKLWGKGIGKRKYGMVEHSKMCSESELMFSIGTANEAYKVFVGYNRFKINNELKNLRTLQNQLYQNNSNTATTSEV